MSGCNDAAIKTHDSTASCRCLYTQRDRDGERGRERERRFSIQALDVWSYIFSGNISTVPLWQTVTLPALRTAPPVRGSPWAPDRALCGRDWILRRISGIYRDKQSATVYFHVCGKKKQQKNSIWLYSSSSPVYLLESWRGQGGTAGGEKATEAGCFKFSSAAGVVLFSTF